VTLRCPYCSAVRQYEPDEVVRRNAASERG
jgi:hypothetical protein